jgi:hypothetical protein
VVVEAALSDQNEVPGLSVVGAAGTVIHGRVVGILHGRGGEIALGILDVEALCGRGRVFVSNQCCASEWIYEWNWVMARVAGIAA